MTSRLETDGRLLHVPLLDGFDLVFVRIGGPGLGNHLFPVYRAFQAFVRDGGDLVWPQFFQLKVGPILRREQDWRWYRGLFSRRSVAEVRRHAGVRLGGLPRRWASPDMEVRTYRGMGRHFFDLDTSRIASFRAVLLQRMRDPAPCIRLCDEVGERDLAVHLRLGDFAASGPESTGQMSQRASGKWYRTQIERFRMEWPSAPVRVFSDDVEEARRILSGLSGLEFPQGADALSTLLFMAAHGTLVASRSSFSLWSAFLGRQRIVAPPGFDPAGFGVLAERG